MQIHVEQISALSGHTAAIYALEKGFDAHEIISAGGDGLVVSWNIDAKNHGKIISKIPDTIFSLLINQSDHEIYVGTLKGGLYKIPLIDNQKPRLMQFHKKSIYSLLLHKQIIIAAGGDGILSLWNASTFQLQEAIQLSKFGLRSLCLFEKENLIFIGDQAGNLFSCNLQTIKMQHLLQLETKQSIFSLLLQTHNNYLILGSRDARIRSVHLTNPTEVNKTTDAHWFTVNDLCELDDRLIISASRDKSIRIWDVDTMQLVHQISADKYPSHKYSVNKLLWMPDDNILLSAGDDKKLLLWKIITQHDIE
ncbi:MAG: hypothetical protein M3Q56_00400 [Bacteroidota bacterium]|nr:hypothetical protein [Bacteroidota bacterium]